MATLECDSTGSVQKTNFSKTDLNKVWLETVLKKQSRNEEVYKILNYETTEATAKGDNYSCDLNRVSMEVAVGSGKLKKISLITKELPATEFRRAMVSAMGVFPKETVMYREVLPSMEDVMSEVCDYSDTLWPDYFDYRPNDRLVLQDLKTAGYKMNNRKLGLDYPHSLLAVRSLAKFHALSVVLKTSGLLPTDIFNTHNLYQNNGMQFQMGDVIGKLFANVVSTIEEKWEPKWKPVGNRLKKILPNLASTLAKTIERDDSKFNVLNHGDCWLNNLLFKYGIDGETPVSLKFVDFQLCFYNTPAYDLQYFLSTSTNLEVRAKLKWNLVEEYHKSLTKFLKLYNYNEEIITFDQLKEEINRFNLFSVVTGALMLPLVFLEKPENMMDLEKLGKDVSNLKDVKMEWLAFSGPNFSKFMKLILTEAADSNAF